MSGAHTSEKRWYRNSNPNGNESVSDKVQAISQNLLNALNQGEEAFQEMNEMMAFAGGTAQLLADQLFTEQWTDRESDPVGNPGVFDTEANAKELGMTTDAIAAVTSIHELYQALTNVAVSQEDRQADLRRMS